MFKFNLKFALRHLYRNKSYSILNILGLAFGMSCSLIILLWIFNEFSYDNFHEKNNRLYQVFRYEKNIDGTSNVSSTLSAPLATALLKDVPEIAAVCRIPWSPNKLIKYKDKAFFENGIQADTSFFQMFSFKLLQGDKKQVLKNVNSIVISRKLATKYFNAEEPIGKQLILKDYEDKLFMVSGIFEDIPKNSSLVFDYVISFQNSLNQSPWLNTEWGNLILNLYIELVPGASQEVVNKKIRDIFHLNHSYSKAELFTQQFNETHLYPTDYKDVKSDSMIVLLRLMAIIAFAILVIACINFANLSSAMSVKRSREIGIKKVLGSVKSRLIIQFLTESLLISFFALLLTITFTELLLPKFNTLFSKSLQLTYSDPIIIITILSVWLFTAFFSGLYPAFVLSSFNPLSVLKSNTLSSLGSKAWFKKWMVVFQFTVAITLIIVTLVINSQIQFVRNKNLGMDKENIMFFSYYKGISKYIHSFKTDLLKCEGVDAVTYCSMNPLQINQSTTDPIWEGKKPDDDRWFTIMTTDFDFIKTLGIKIKDGRDFSPALSTDSTNYIINEKAALDMGLKNPVGQRLTFGRNKGIIIGVVKDFHSNYISTPIVPIIININPQNTHKVFIRLSKENSTKTIKQIEQIFKKYEPDYPFEFTFQDEFFTNMYKNNLFLIGNLSSIFSVLAIIISCLGLYGLTSYAAEQRTKEIGIRKVSGARSIEVLHLLLLDFLKWVGLSLIIALPLGYYLSTLFLKVFPYHYNLTIWIFFAATTIALIISVVTVSWQTLKAARRNPIESLRYE